MAELSELDLWLLKLRGTLNEFSLIPESEWLKLKGKLRVIHIKKNHNLFEAGDIPDKLSYIVKGVFRVYYITDSGDESILVFRSENRFLSPYSSLLENIPSKYYFQALEDSILLCISTKEWNELSTGHNCWQTVTLKYSQMIFIEMEKRLNEMRSDDPLTRYNTFTNRYPNLVERINQYHVASYLGITPEALSRIRKRVKIDLNQ